MQSSRPFAESLPIELSLDFVNTVSYRRSSQRRQEWLLTDDGFLKWCSKKGLISDASASRLAKSGETILPRALALRESLYAVYSALSAGRQPPKADSELVAEEFAAAICHARLDSSGESWKIDGLGSSAESGLWPIAISAGLLLASDLRTRIRECADAECGWLFLDTSKNRSRKWCSMADCGNLNKARRYYSKHRSQ